MKDLKILFFFGRRSEERWFVCLFFVYFSKKKKKNKYDFTNQKRQSGLELTVFRSCGWFCIIAGRGGEIYTEGFFCFGRDYGSGPTSSAEARLLILGYLTFSSSWLCAQISIFRSPGSLGSARSVVFCFFSGLSSEFGMEQEKN